MILASLNVRALPPMRQPRVVNDIARTLNGAGVIGWQEIRPRRYKRALIREARRRRFRGTGVRTTTTPVTHGPAWRKLRAGRRPLHGSAAGVTRRRRLTWELIGREDSSAYCAVISTHFVPPGRPFRRAKRLALYNAGHENLAELVRDMVDRGWPVAVCVDANRRRGLLPSRIGPHARRVHSVTPGIEHVYLVDGAEYVWDDPEHMHAARHSDHPALIVHTQLRPRKETDS